MIETKDLILRKAMFEDWRDMYERVWSREETARYMLWEVTRCEEDAKSRMERTVQFQQVNPTAFLVCERKNGRAIGFAGIKEIREGVYEDCGVAVGPEYVGKGYGKQVLNALVELVFGELGADRFICSCRAENEASRRLQLSCGFWFSHTEDRTDPRDGMPYVVEFYELTRQTVGDGK